MGDDRLNDLMVIAADKEEACIVSI